MHTSRREAVLSPNVCAYVEADPINFIDPLGLQEVEPPPPIVVTGSTCPEGWTCYDPGYGFQTLWHPAPGITGGEIVVTASRPRSSGTHVLRGIISRLDWVANIVRPPEPRRDDETFIQCFGRIVSPENAAVGAAAVEMGRGNPALYPHGAPSGASGTSYISTTIRRIEKAFGGGGVGSRGNYWFGAKTMGGAIGRGLSSASVVAGVAVESFELGRAAGAAQVCQ